MTAALIIMNAFSGGLNAAMLFAHRGPWKWAALNLIMMICNMAVAIGLAL